MLLLLSLPLLSSPDHGFLFSELYHRPQVGINVLPVGSLVCVTSYSPFQGFRGTVRSVHTIAADLDEHFCFYLIALEGVQMKVPMWFEYDEVELVAPLVALQANDELASLKLTPKRAFEL